MSQDVAGMLKPLIAQARAEKKWLWCHHQSLWFSPDQLEEENANGKFLWGPGNWLWGPGNWQLRDPEERVTQARSVLRAAEDEYDRILREVRGA